MGDGRWAGFVSLVWWWIYCGDGLLFLHSCCFDEGVC